MSSASTLTFVFNNLSFVIFVSFLHFFLQTLAPPSVVQIANSNAVEATVSSFLDDEDASTVSARRRRVNTKSKDFLEFRPKREGGLYKKLIEEGANNSEDVAIDLLLMIKTRPYTGLLTLFEYFLDLCGFQHLDIKKIYNTIDMNLETIINIAHSNTTSTNKSGKYLMRAGTNYPEKVMEVAFCFIENLVMNDESFVLIHVNKPNNVVKFVSVMCRSNHRAICHTGCVIAVKMNSAYSKKSHQLNTAIHSPFSVNEELRTITEVQWNLWKIIERISHINDRYLVEMRRACAKEMLVWFKGRPEHFFESEIYIVNFLKFFLDSSTKVRLTALETCRKMFGSYNLLCGYSSPYEDRIISEVIKRIGDINLDVAAKAVDICTSLFEINQKVLTVAGRISPLMLSYYYPLAAACGRYVITCLRHTKNLVFCSSGILKGLVEVYKVLPKNTNKEVALIVEAVIDCTPELQNWNIFIDLLLGEDTDLTADKYFLLEFLCQSIMQTVTGKCEVVREKPRKADPRKSINKNIVTVIAPHLYTFLNLYGKRKQNASLLFETIDVLNFSYLEKTEQNENHMIQLYASIVGFFKHTHDIELAVNALKTLRKFCDTNSHFQKPAAAFYENLEVEVLECFNNDHLVSVDRKIMWLRLAAAMETTVLYKKICWSQIFTDTCRDNDQWGQTHCLGYQLVACKWFIYHQTREFVQSYNGEENNTALSQLSKEIQEYGTCLFDLLLGAEAIALEAFKQLCEIKVLMEEILQEAIKINENLTVLRIEMSDGTVIKTFCDILQKSVIHTSSPFDLKTRRMYLNYAFHWLLKGEPLKQLHIIISFYGEYYEEFGYIFDKTLQFIKTNAPLTFMVIVHKALLYVFNETRFDMNDLLHSMKGATAIKKLAKQMAHACLKISADAVKVIEFSVKYIMKNLQHLHFFFVLTYFVERLDGDDCIVLYDNLKAEIPKDYQDHPGFLNFMGTLKKKMPKPGKGRRRKTVRNKESSSSVTTSTESYSIHDESD